MQLPPGKKKKNATPKSDQVPILVRTVGPYMFLPAEVFSKDINELRRTSGGAELVASKQRRLVLVPPTVLPLLNKSIRSSIHEEMTTFNRQSTAEATKDDHVLSSHVSNCIVKETSASSKIC